MEKLALYTNKDELTDKYINRKDRFSIKDDLYYRIVIIFIENSNHQFLIQKVSQRKGGEYATTGGHVQYGDSSLKTIIKETYEELGIDISKDNIKLIKTYKYPHIFQDIYYLKKDININDILLQKEEVELVKWMSIEEINKLILNKKFRKNNINPLNDVIEMNKNI